MIPTKKMADGPQATAPDDLRRDVRRALESSRMDSLTHASKFVGGLAAICGVVGGGVAALKVFTLVWLVGLALITVLGGVLAYVVNELSRLGRHSALLEKLLDGEKYYDSMLRTANEAQQVAERGARELQTRLDVVVANRELIVSELRALGASPQAQTSLPPGTGGQNG
jgi:hypothetical protein